MGARKSFIFSLAVFAALAPAGCIGPTHYQPVSDGEGYGDQQIADNKYRVTFFGNSVTPRNVVDNDMLYRAAELTLSTGNDYFVLLSHDVERDVTYRSYVDVPGPYFGPYPYLGPYPYGYGWGRFYDPFYDGYFGGYAEVTTQAIEKYRAYGTIAVFKGERPKDDPDAYDARDVMQRLAGSILRPPP